MLKATEEEIEEVREYFEWQAPDLEVTFMQKVYSEAVLNTRHDVWDIHTNKDRWWVITGGTNLYSQEQFPNMDLALTFHIGLSLRIPRTAEQQEGDQRILPFGCQSALNRDPLSAFKRDPGGTSVAGPGRRSFQMAKPDRASGFACSGSGLEAPAFVAGFHDVAVVGQAIE
ncbi:hypothetical protein [Nitratireductor thuwali]|uniref:Uncharacterized protein n=1 Tax=Nitratireductor thuwali TaxID=2267699 RepID=A0ABY5MQ65_9HYPH|nr:hypothetical protein NTH_04578 [Nitratireductor thuwali]